MMGLMLIHVGKSGHWSTECPLFKIIYLAMSISVTAHYVNKAMCGWHKTGMRNVINNPGNFNTIGDVWVDESILVKIVEPLLQIKSTWNSLTEDVPLCVQ